PPHAAGPRRLRGDRRGRSLRRMDRHPARALRHVPQPADRHGGAAGGGALRGVLPALRLLRGIGGGGQAGRRALQRKSLSRSCLTASRPPTVAPGGTATSFPPTAPVTRALIWLRPWVKVTAISVRPSARA